jgi:hypothetical protein
MVQEENHGKKNATVEIVSKLSESNDDFGGDTKG